MKEKIDQKGFILTPILIIAIIVILASSAGVGVVLHKQGKLVSNNTNTASISEAVIQNKEFTSAKNEGAEEQESKSEQELKIEITPKDEKIAQQKIDKNEIAQQEQKLAEKPELQSQQPATSNSTSPRKNYRARDYSRSRRTAVDANS